MLRHLLAYPIRSGVFIGVLLGIPHLLVSDRVSVLLAAMTLVFIAGIYVGFAFIHGEENPFRVEVVVAAGYVLVALLGTVVSRWIISAGLLAHGVWDLVHHRKNALLTPVPNGYASFCAVTDVVFALILVGAWLNR